VSKKIRLAEQHAILIRYGEEVPMKSKKSDFVLWLKKRKQTVESFAREAGVSYNTASKWCYGVKPHPFVRETLHPKFPDCPLFV